MIRDFNVSHLYLLLSLRNFTHKVNNFAMPNNPQRENSFITKIVVSLYNPKIPPNCSFFLSYNFLPEYDLKKIPMETLLASNGIVVVWVTNKQKYIEFVKDVLFPYWDLELIGHWHWVKVYLFYKRK